MSSLKFLRQASDPTGTSCLSERSNNVLLKKKNNNSLFTQRDTKTIQKCIITKHLPIRKVVSKERLLPERTSSDSNSQSTARLTIAPQSATAKKQSLIVPLIQVRPNSKASSRNQDTDIASNGISLAGSQSTSAQSSAKLNKNNYFSKIIPTLNLCSQKDQDKDLNNSSENSIMGSTCQFGSLKPEDKEIIVQNYVNNESVTPSTKRKVAKSTTAKPKKTSIAEVNPFGKERNQLPEMTPNENPFENVTLPKAVIDLVEENNNLKIENNKKEELIDYLLNALQKQNQNQDVTTENATSKLSDLLAGPNPLKNKKKIIPLNKFQLNSSDRITALPIPITTRITRDIKDSSIFSRGHYSVRGRSQESAGSQERGSELSSSRQNHQLSKLPTLTKNFPELPEVSPGAENSHFVFHSRNTPLSQEQISSMRAKSKIVTPANPYGFQMETQKTPTARKPRHMLPNGNGIINIFCNPNPSNVKDEIKESPKWENLSSRAAFDFNGTFNPGRFIAMAENVDVKPEKIARSSSKKEFPTIHSARYFDEFTGNDKENEGKPNFKVENNIALGNLLNPKPTVGKFLLKINRRINSQAGEQSKEFHEASSLASVASRPTENPRKEKFPKEVFTLNIRKKFF